MRDRAVDLKAGFRPSSNPVAIMQVCVAGLSVAHKGFVMASARAKRTSPAAMAFILRVDVAAVKKLFTLLFVDARRDMPESVLIGIDEPMARCNITRGSHTYETQSCTAGECLIHSLVQFGKCVAYI